MASTRRTGRSRLTVALLILTSLALLTLDFRNSAVVSAARRGASSAFSPLRGVVETATGPFTNGWHGITGYGDLKSENDKLRAQIDKMRGSAVQDKDAAAQLGGVLDQLDISWVGNIPTSTARVVAGPLSNFSHTIEIDKGSGDGFEVGMPVVNGAGLVGRLVQVTARHSSVQLLTDPELAVGVRLVPDGAPGTARGTGAGENLAVDTGLEATAKVDQGAALTTSGADRSAFPGSIPVGSVVRTRKGSGGLTLDLVVKPFADTERLSYVTVLLWSGAG